MRIREVDGIGVSGRNAALKYCWILDNGHGINTPGKRSPVWPDGSQLLEWEFNRDIVRRLACLLTNSRVPHVILVPETTDVGLKQRCTRANSVKSSHPRIFLSIHANAADSPQASGVEIFTYFGRNKADEISEVILDHYKRLLPDFRQRKDLTDGDGDKEAAFYVLKYTQIPAMLLECGFMTNYEECRKLMNPEVREKIATAIHNAILQIHNS